MKNSWAGRGINTPAPVRTLFMALMASVFTLHLAAAAAASVVLPSLAPVIKAASPAVVNIATRGTLTECTRQSLREDPYFRRFFNSPEGGGVRLRQFQSAGQA